MTVPRLPGLAPLVLLAIAACARMGPPPGGPPDRAAPLLIGTVPESTGTFPDWKSDVEFRFDEVVSEGGSPNLGTGTGDLEKLVILSPTQEIPVVRWKRDRITVRPREGWQPDRVYRIELLPGIIDLRRNRSDTSVVLTFATGGPPPTDTIRGVVIDWAAGRPGRQALVELYLLPDSLIYRAVADSNGRFTIGPLPAADWTIYAVIDQNRNHRRESRESWDSTVIAAGTASAPTLWMIPRDTVGPRITTITADDSLKATITFTLPLDPNQAVESLGVSFLRQEDSVPVPFLSLLPKPLDDSVESARRSLRDTAAADSIPAMERAPVPGKAKPPRAAADTGRALAAKAQIDSIVKSRPALYDRLVLRVGEPFIAERRYLVEIRGLRSVAGATGDTRGVLAIPKPRAVPKPAADSAAAAPDSTGHARDSSATRPPPKP
ncbi:MAG: Ig-like domain-containing protein [Gemmatimonadota bacterium]|nr:Ig-like domain-containing protein [Gemmatimonadota bacterium]MDH4348617.1 Ig-like domain-containing protein [Gemmatimonadota bacterium]